MYLAWDTNGGKYCRLGELIYCVGGCAYVGRAASMAIKAQQVPYWLIVVLLFTSLSRCRDFAVWAWRGFAVSLGDHYNQHSDTTLGICQIIRSVAWQ